MCSPLLSLSSMTSTTPFLLHTTTTNTTMKDLKVTNLKDIDFVQMTIPLNLMTIQQHASYNNNNKSSSWARQRRLDGLKNMPIQESWKNLSSSNTISTLNVSRWDSLPCSKNNKNKCSVPVPPRRRTTDDCHHHLCNPAPRDRTIMPRRSNPSMVAKTA